MDPKSLRFFFFFEHLNREQPLTYFICEDTLPWEIEQNVMEFILVKFKYLNISQTKDSLFRSKKPNDNCVAL